MKKVSRELLAAMLEELQGYPELEQCLGELIDPEMGTVSGFQDIIDSIAQLRDLDLDEYDPL